MIGVGCGVEPGVAAGLSWLTVVGGRVAEGALPIAVSLFVPPLPGPLLLPVPTSRMLTRNRRSTAPLPIAIFA